MGQSGRGNSVIQKVCKKEGMYIRNNKLIQLIVSVEESEINWHRNCTLS